MSLPMSKGVISVASTDLDLDVNRDACSKLWLVMLCKRSMSTRFPLSKKGYRYLLTAVCGFTKYLICVPITDKVSVTVADALMRHLYLVYEAPEILVHDQGGEIWSDVMTELLDIQPSKITSHRPNSSGVVERVYGTLHSVWKTS